MADIAMIAIFLVFFAVCVAYVRWCERIIGPDETVGDVTVRDEPAGELVRR